MLRLSLRNLRAHVGRLLLSTFAVVLGVAFVTGSFVFSDTLKATFNEVFNQTSADVVVEPVKDLNRNVEDASVTLPESVVETIEAVEGVDRAIGGVFVQGLALVDSDGELITSTTGAPSFGGDWYDDPELTALTLQEGRGPERAGEVAIDTETARKNDVAVGDRLRVVSRTADVTAEVVGIVKYGSTGNLVGASIVVFEPDVAQRLLAAPGRITRVDVAAEDGVSQEELAERVRAVLPDDGSVRVITGEQEAEESADEIDEALSFIDYLVLAFGGIAVVVGVFLILNTFSMLVASRARELALLRALGASRGQVSRSVIVEAFAVGLVGATLGLLLGLGLATGLTSLMSSLGLDLPDRGLVVALRTVVVAYVVGVGVTLASAWFPARRASALPPVAAMSTTVSLPTRSAHRRVAVGALVLVLGVLALVAGVGTEKTADAASLVGLGALLSLLGVAVVAPVLVGPIVAVLGWPVRRVSRMTGRLAVDNAGRNRVRTAGTAAALMIGLAVVTTFSVLGSSVKASVDQAVDNTLATDFIVQPRSFGDVGFPGAIVEQLESVDGVGSVLAAETVEVRLDGRRTTITAITPGTADDNVKTVNEGGAWATLVDGEIAVDGDTAEEDGVALGDTLTLTLPRGERTVRVTILYEGDGFSGYVVPAETARAGGVDPVVAVAFVSAAPDADVAQVRAGLDEVAERTPLVKVEDGTEFKESQRAQVDQTLAIIYVLLALSILIAVLGIVNTLALSVIERTREIGLLRAVGMSRTQVRRMIRWESVIIACLGAVLGIVLGLVYGAALQNVLSEEGLLVLDVPVGQLVVYVVLAALVGVVAAVRPARRAARLDVLRAIASE